MILRGNSQSGVYAIQHPGENQKHPNNLGNLWGHDDEIEELGHRSFSSTSPVSHNEIRRRMTSTVWLQASRRSPVTRRYGCDTIWLATLRFSSLSALTSASQLPLIATHIWLSGWELGEEAGSTFQFMMRQSSGERSEASPLLTGSAKRFPQDRNQDVIIPITTKNPTDALLNADEDPVDEGCTRAYCWAEFT